MAGRIRDQAMICLDLQVGRWLHRKPNSRRVVGISTVFELHYLAALEDSRTLNVFAPNTDVTVGNERNRFDVLTATGGFDFIFQNGVSLGVGVMLPLRKGATVSSTLSSKPR